MVSIITPSYNSSKFIGETIASVKNQSYTNWEMIIVDDCSKDNSVEVIETFCKEDKRIILIPLCNNVGAAEARNMALRKAKGRFIAFLDSDDLWEPEKLRIQIAFMIENNYAITCTHYKILDPNRKSINPRIIKSKPFVGYNGVLLYCPVGNSTVIYDSQIIGKVEVPNIKKRNDDALWLKILKIEKYIYGLDKVLASYRLTPNSISSNKFDLIKYHWQLYRKIENLSYFRSVFHIIVWAIIKILKIK